MCSSTSSPYTCTWRRVGTWEPSSPATMYITLLFEEFSGVFAELLFDFATCNSSKECIFTQDLHTTHTHNAKSLLNKGFFPVILPLWNWPEEQQLLAPAECDHLLPVPAAHWPFEQPAAPELRDLWPETKRLSRVNPAWRNMYGSFWGALPCK